ncbi:hypothetical protein DBR29_32455 [Pseudomonas sp. HMWF005]|nr:hypothetical protein DBR29_32455 [Pseudomonas sp. HMWF005]
MPAVIEGLISAIGFAHQNLLFRRISAAGAVEHRTGIGAVADFQAYLAAPAGHVPQAVQNQGVGVRIGHRVQFQPF